MIQDVNATVIRDCQITMLTCNWDLTWNNWNWISGRFQCRNCWF